MYSFGPLALLVLCHMCNTASAAFYGIREREERGRERKVLGTSPLGLDAGEERHVAHVLHDGLRAEARLE